MTWWNLCESWKIGLLKVRSKFLNVTFLKSSLPPPPLPSLPTLLHNSKLYIVSNSITGNLKPFVKSRGFYWQRLHCKWRVGENPIYMSGSDLCISKNETAQHCYFLNRIIMFSLLSSTFMCLVVMATLAKRKRTKASKMVFSSISKRSEHLR